MSTIAGIDYSLNCPAICVYSGSRDSFEFSKCKFFCYQNNVTERKKLKIKQLGLRNISIIYQQEQSGLTERYLKLALWGWNVISLCHADTAVMESYSMGSKGRVFELAEATGYMKLGIYLYNIPLTLFSPSSIKKEFTGKGNADKAKMSEAFKEREGFYVHELLNESNPKNSPCSDIVDSYAIVYKFLQSVKGER